MRRQFATLLSAVAIAAGIGGAPIAAADPNSGPNPEESCATAGASSTVCQSPGDAEINDAPPPVDFYPYGGEAGLI